MRLLANFLVAASLRGALLSASVGLLMTMRGAAEENMTKVTPIVPVGDDAYLQWERLPYQRLGVRGRMQSTFDRTGGNRDADASHFLYQQADDFNVALDARGPGMLYFVRTNHHHGSPWHYETDGVDHIVKESATDNPVGANERLTQSLFTPSEPFPHPLVWTWPDTKGADLMWRPIPFRDSLRLAYSRTFYGTGYYIYHQFADAKDGLSRPIESWTPAAPDPGVVELFERAGTDIAPTGDGVAISSGNISLPSHEWQRLEAPAGSPAMVRAVKFSAPRERAFELGKCRLRITWDDRWHPSIDAPLDLFFGAGQLHNDDDREFLVKGLPMVVRFDAERVYLDCYWSMPYFNNARIELVNSGENAIDDVAYEIRAVPYRDPVNHVAYFHATYSDHSKPTAGQDVLFLDTSSAEGGGEWSGHFVGMSWTFTDRGNLRTLEGDPRFFFDGSRTPQAQGTGTEEWGGGGDYWGGRNMTTPLAGHPVGREHGKHSNERDLVNSAYRFLIADIFPFGSRAVIGLEHGGGNTSAEHYSGVAYWYGAPSATLVQTDALNVCNEADAKTHAYRSPTATKPYELISRYEWGPDSDAPGWWHEQSASATGAVEYYPAERDEARSMTGVSEFTLRLDPQNLGVLLRRKLDYQFPNQRANVSVRAAGSDAGWQPVGQWYTAGSNRSVHSRPQGGNFTEAELAPTEHNVITSNRRWRDDEFLIPRRLTHGVDRLEVRVEHVPDNRALYPGHPFPVANAWSESRYLAFCYRLPEIKANSPSR
ncbi:DUF2961 domain-containing protein [Lacipirellula sp.]|uniref:DUF2961 domain-containing protein n=1 Tax=Lacipirellula sp. TaxID=2691419 RepID=UPI003D125F3F